MRVLPGIRRDKSRGPAIPPSSAQSPQAETEPLDPSPLPVEAEIEMATMSHFLHAAHGFALAFAEVNAKPFERELIAALRASNDDLSIIEIDIASVGIEPGLGTRIVERSVSAGAVFLVGLDPFVTPGAAEQPVLSQLDLARNRLAGELGVPLVIWMPTYVLAEFAFRAPNLWSLHIDRFVFASDAERAHQGAIDARDGPGATAADRQRERVRLEHLMSEITNGDRPDLRAGLLWRLGDIARLQARYVDSEQLLRAALPIYQSIGDRLGEANTLRSLGNVASSQSVNEQAAQLLRSALSMYREIGSKPGEANTLRSLGNVASSQNQYSDAEQLLENALSIHQTCGDSLGEAHTLLSLGNVARRERRFEDAERLLNAALTIYRSIADQTGEANTLNSLGDLAYTRNRLTDAEQLLTACLGMYRNTGNVLGEANTLHSLGNVASSSGHYEDAEQLLRSALTIFQNIGNRQSEANALISLGDLARTQARYDDAARRLRSAVEIYQTIGNRQGEANALMSLGRTAMAAGDREQAAELLKLSSTTYADIGNSHWAEIAAGEASAAATNA
jgi:tetratricopeptide (TPR) repeat protein